MNCGPNMNSMDSTPFTYFFVLMCGSCDVAVCLCANGDPVMLTLCMPMLVECASMYSDVRCSTSSRNDCVCAGRHSALQLSAAAARP